MTSTATGRAIQLEVVPDLLGDGAGGWVGSNHVNTVTGEPEPPSEVSLLTPLADVTRPRSHHPISEGIDPTHRGGGLPGRSGRVRSQ